MMNYKYVTLLTSDNYVDGVLLLKESLRMVNSKYSLLCLITNNLSFETLTKLNKANIETKLVVNIPAPDNIYQHNKKIDVKMAETWKDTFTKFHIFNLEEYDKIIFLDADLLILKNVDHCFEYEDMTAAVDGEYFNLWPNDFHFNSGFMVLKPSTKRFNDLFDYVNNLNPSQVRNYLGKQQLIADQDILNLYFKEWKTSPSKQLNKYYNIFAPYIFLEQEDDVKENAYFIHFVGSKPWNLDWSYLKGTIKNAPLRCDYFYIKAQGIIQYLYETDFKDIDWNNTEKLNLLTAQLSYSLFNNLRDVTKFYKDPNFEKALKVKQPLVDILTQIYINEKDVNNQQIHQLINAISVKENIDIILLYYNMIKELIKNQFKDK